MASFDRALDAFDPTWDLFYSARPLLRGSSDRSLPQMHSHPSMNSLRRSARSDRGELNDTRTGDGIGKASC